MDVVFMVNNMAGEVKMNPFFSKAKINWSLCRFPQPLLYCLQNKGNFVDINNSCS